MPSPPARIELSANVEEKPFPIIIRGRLYSRGLIVINRTSAGFQPLMFGDGTRTWDCGGLQPPPPQTLEAPARWASGIHTAVVHAANTLARSGSGEHRQVVQAYENHWDQGKNNFGVLFPATSPTPRGMRQFMAW